MHCKGAKCFRSQPLEFGSLSLNIEHKLRGGVLTFKQRRAVSKLLLGSLLLARLRSQWSPGSFKYCHVITVTEKGALVMSYEEGYDSYYLLRANALFLRLV